ncbi:intradiol ring-cleavage dioxygenase [Aminobacter carboxidus]|uniref:Intradiol ring-cleavage dioxygenase n=1 Tax=Aminobacter carboxidus TaxID=376165 RepID=A0ABR9GU74_9HYPH|nr:intradiol ring-cleavage dioxygenase [Aminobacter carboxidus]MBE1207224.1 intradiol ring-cleavage dioxygenase [Aminobacter carboxidus]
MQKSSFPGKLSRRRALGLIAVTAGGTALVPVQLFAQQASPASGTALLMPEAGVCSITPETTEGPYYFDPELERSEITEGREGVKLTVRLQVVDEACNPIEGARVDLWHCDATGHYSGYPGQGDNRDVDTSGQKFLRGWQRADKTGIVSFETIYPGWYRGRTTHIHFKAFPREGFEMTGQIFFPDDVSEHIFSTWAPYATRGGQRDTMNADDGILRRAGPGVQSAVSEAASAYEAVMIIAVKRAG